MVAPRVLPAEEGIPVTGIYVVDMQRVIDESIVGKAAKNTIEAEMKKRQAALQSSQAEIVRLRGELEKQSALLSRDALDQKRVVLERKERDFARLMQDQRAELEKKRSSEMARLIREIDSVVADLSRKGNIPFVLERDPRLVVFVAEEFNLTPQVIKILNDMKTSL